jgi:hypothetical protein
MTARIRSAIRSAVDQLTALSGVTALKNLRGKETQITPFGLIRASLASSFSLRKIRTGREAAYCSGSQFDNYG